MIDWIGNFIAQGTALLMFASLAILGMIVSIFSLVFGGDHDTDHDFDHDMDHDGGGGDSDHGDHGDDGPGVGAWLLFPVLSVRGMALLATGFGALGYITYSITSKLLFSCGVGTLSGWLFAFIGFMFIRAFKKQESTSVIFNETLIGRGGIVTISIPDNGVGEVTLTIPGQGQVTRSATAKQAIRSGQAVTIVRAYGSSVEVEQQY